MVKNQDIVHASIHTINSADHVLSSGWRACMAKAILMLLRKACKTHTTKHIRTASLRSCLPAILPSLETCMGGIPMAFRKSPAAGCNMGCGTSAMCCRLAPSLGGMSKSSSPCQCRKISEELTACLPASHVIREFHVIYLDICQPQTGFRRAHTAQTNSL